MTIAALIATTALATPAMAGPPSSVTMAGSFQTEVGCSGDWDPTCGLSNLTPGAEDGVWRGAFALFAGGYEYKAALDGSWAENYGVGAVANGANIQLSINAPTTVRFYYDDVTHWATDSVNSVIVTAAGSFQSELGCSGDWEPTCLRSWLEDPDGDGAYTLTTTAIPAGDYDTNATIDEGWGENYGSGGVAGGPSIAFTVPGNATTTFSYTANTHLLTVTSVANDSTPPVIVAETSPPAPDGASGWYVGSPTVAFSVTDAESAITGQTGCGTTTVTTDGATPLTCTATSAGGTASASVDVQRDATPPAITCPATPTFDLRAAGAVLVADVADATAGPTQPLVSTAVDTSVVGTHLASLTATDRAGNQTTTTCPYVVSGAMQPHSTVFLVDVSSPAGGGLGLTTSLTPGNATLATTEADGLLTFAFSSGSAPAVTITLGDRVRLKGNPFLKPTTGAHPLVFSVVPAGVGDPCPDASGTVRVSTLTRIGPDRLLGTLRLAFSYTCAGITSTGHLFVVGDPVARVVSGDDEESVVADGERLAWSVQRGQHLAVRFGNLTLVNTRNDLLAAALHGSSLVVQVQPAVGVKADIRIWNLKTHRYQAPLGVNTRGWDYGGAYDGRYMLAAHGKPLAGGSHTVRLHDLTTGRSRLLAATVSSRIEYIPGEVRSGIATWSTCIDDANGVYLACSTSWYAIADQRAGTIRHPKGELDYLSTVDGKGNVVLARGAANCGEHARLMRYDRHTRKATELAELEPGRDLSGLTFGSYRHPALIYSTLDCAGVVPGDIFALPVQAP